MASSAVLVFSCVCVSEAVPFDNSDSCEAPSQELPLTVSETSFAPDKSRVVVVEREVMVTMKELDNLHVMGKSKRFSREFGFSRRLI